jgi:flagellar hook protein FlgE
MVKSLWSGVSGLQAHQIAMDVESNNIANVNTVGFKYSRANFSDMLSQTYRVATAPQGDMGGKNDLQVGLGTFINSTTKIFSQGSIQNTDKATDMAIQGDGFFVISPDAGATYRYTRNGDFSFDNAGNLVDNNGYIVQGWTKQIAAAGESCDGDANYDQVDTTQPMSNIQVEPGLKLPAKSSSTIQLKANLNSGSTVESSDCIYHLDRYNKAADLSVVDYFDEQQARNDSDSVDTDTDAATPNYLDDQVQLNGQTYYENSYSTNVTYQAKGIDENAASQFVIIKDADGNDKIVEKGENFGVLFNSNGEAFNLQSKDPNFDGEGIWLSMKNASVTAANNVAAGVIPANAIEINDMDGNLLAKVPSVATAAGNTATDNAQAIADAVNAISGTTGVSAEIIAGPKLVLKNDNTGTYKNVNVNVVSATTGFAAGAHASNTMKQFVYTDLSAQKAGWKNTDQTDSDVFYFRTTEDLRDGLQDLALDPDADGAVTANATDDQRWVTVDSYGRYQVNNGYSSTEDLYITTDGISGQTNSLFLETFQSLEGSLPTKNYRTSQGLKAATHASSIEVYDSLGSKHSVRLEFRKTDSNEWSFMVRVPEPAEISVTEPKHIFAGGIIKFGENGGLASFNPPTLSFSPNNGAQGNQMIRLDLGSIGGFDGVTSLDNTSTTSGISQDGYASGELLGIRVDQTGTLMGSFTNGRSLALAQVAMAKFTNNSGLTSEGNSMYSQSSNSGEPVVGIASTGGRGSVQASSLEMSNADLSRSLTQLIVVQRGFQANSKTITTSDQMLNTLLQLKQ